jgi:hypothetical protein
VLLSLQHAFDLSDEKVVWQWVENPYRQVFTGETYLQTQPPLDPSSLTRWRKRLGEAGVEALLAETIEVAKRAGVIKASSVIRVIVDTTVMEKVDCPSNRFAVARAVSRTSGEGSCAAWPEAAAELQPRGAASGALDWPLRSREAVQSYGERHCARCVRTLDG